MGAQASLLKNCVVNVVMFNVYQEPVVIKNFISHEDCDFLMKFEPEKFKESGILQQNNDTLNSNIRKSRQKVHNHESHEIIMNVLNKCSKIAKKSISFFERIHIVHYKPGGFFKPHKDGDEAGHNRIYSFLIYLNDDYEGGETNFPLLNKSYKLDKGDALFFHNFNTNFSNTNLSTHEGCIVKNGEKWVANVWIHPHSIERLLD
jgi:prolyl 4-hydroxylase